LYCTIITIHSWELDQSIHSWDCVIGVVRNSHAWDRVVAVADETSLYKKEI
jgi:hypothetical protein